MEAFGGGFRPASARIQARVLSTYDTWTTNSSLGLVAVEAGSGQGAGAPRFSLEISPAESVTIRYMKRTVFTALGIPSRRSKGADSVRHLRESGELKSARRRAIESHRGAFAGNPLLGPLRISSGAAKRKTIHSSD